jgi:decaprenylphospho-beta-D-ribofuranose 2-oxidase
VRAIERTLSGWGRRPTVAALEVEDRDLAAAARDAVLTRGRGRSYGDASLPAVTGARVANSRAADRVIALDEAAGRLRVQAGATLASLAPFLRRRGLVLPVVPGTAEVSVGGMVAADIHGKNHHVAGTIGGHVRSLTILLADGDIRNASRETEPELFRATLGGMGLTGHILDVELDLERIASPWIWAEHRRVADIDDLLGGLREAAGGWPMTMSWCDMTARGGSRGRGELIVGRWAEEGESGRGAPALQTSIAVPFTAPDLLLNPLLMRAFNTLKFAATPRQTLRRIEHPDTFFHPLDRLREWHRMYGPRGMIQVQCVLPHDESHRLYHRFFDLLERNGQTCFLAVIKDCGEQGEGLLSFPKPGVSFALDFPFLERRTPRAVARLNDFIASEGGRIYLAKDAFTSAPHFRAMEGPRYAAFVEARDRFDPQGRLDSAQARRLFGDRSKGTS